MSKQVSEKRGTQTNIFFCSLPHKKGVATAALKQISSSVASQPQASPVKKTQKGAKGATVKQPPEQPDPFKPGGVHGIKPKKPDRQVHFCFVFFQCVSVANIYSIYVFSNCCRRFIGQYDAMAESAGFPDKYTLEYVKSYLKLNGNWQVRPVSIYLVKLSLVRLRKLTARLRKLTARLD